MTQDFRSLLIKTKSSGFVSREELAEVEALEASVASGDITEEEGADRLAKMRSNFGREKPVVAQRDWKKIKEFIDVAEARAIRRTRLQFVVGTFAVPLGALIAGSTIPLGWLGGNAPTSVVGLVGALLAALSAHSFFVLRVHQQATTAAERLVEKKLALLFLEAALGPGHEDRSQDLMSAGTAMFLGHHAPQTLLLSPEDLRKSKDG